MLRMDATVHTADQPAAPPALVSRPRGTSGGMGLKQVITRVEKMTATILGKGIRNACPSRQRDASCWIPPCGHSAAVTQEVATACGDEALPRDQGDAVSQLLVQLAYSDQRGCAHLFCV